MIEIDFASLLRGAAGITALCDTRIYPVVLPEQLTLPAIHYMFVGGSSQGTQDTYGVQEYRVEVNCWATNYDDAIALRHAVIAALSQYDQTNISIRFLMNRDLFEHDALQYRAIAEFYLTNNFTP